MIYGTVALVGGRGTSSLKMGVFGSALGVKNYIHALKRNVSLSNLGHSAAVKWSDA